MFNFRDNSVHKFVALSACSLFFVGCGGGSESAPVAVPPPAEVTSEPPSIVVSENQFVNGSEQVTITASITDDLGVESIEWTQTQGPTVSLNGTDTPELTFTAPTIDIGQDLEFRLTASDAQQQTATALITVTVNPTLNSTDSLSVNIDALNSVDLLDPEAPLVVIVGRTALPIIDIENVTIPIEDNQENKPVIIAQEDGTPILMSFSGAKNGEIEISIASSATAFVLRSPRFYGTKIINRQALIDQIQNHDKFENLVETLREELRTSICPMDAGCSALAAIRAERISQDLNLEGLVEEGG